MTNLEWLEKRGLITKNYVYEDRCEDCGVVGANIVIALRDCDYYDYKKKGIDWLLEEHKEPIKLKRFEYDLIRTNDSSHNTSFRTFNTYINMKSIGYFDGITNTSMTLKEILENCEVVE